MASDKVEALNWVNFLYQLGQDNELKTVYGELLKHIVEELQADRGSLSLIEEDGSPRLVAAIGCGQCKVGQREACEGTLLSKALTEGRDFLAGEGNDLCGIQGMVEEGRGLAMCWLLRLDERIIGALCICRNGSRESYGQEDFAYGGVLVSLAAVVIENMRMHAEQQGRIDELSRVNARVQEINKKLEHASNQLLQSEKMASIGQLAAGVAHEINNPIGYVYSNIGTLEKYLRDFFTILDAYEKSEASLDEASREEIRKMKQNLDLAFLKQDVLALLSESREGINRVKKIVQDLKDFSHAGTEEEWQWADLHKGLESTLNIVWNELKYKAEVVKEFGDLPRVYCLPFQLNQVFMNLLVNAAHAIQTKGTITVRTGAEGERVWVEVEDTGSGIPPENLPRIFDPFYTTKPVGKGTGLGLSVSYSIIEKHHGRFEVKSEVGKGTVFRVWLPVNPAEGDAGKA